ncbi:MAG: hypothetical protein IPG59_22555 [Candidatus Melainabacteria bacterium]|nr:MAG: hypothetical protein IPG59_22555 [Candidatus Melainabacteria bacterium]
MITTKQLIRKYTLALATVLFTFAPAYAKPDEAFDPTAYIKTHENEFVRISVENKPTFMKIADDNPTAYEARLSQITTSPTIKNIDILKSYGALSMAYSYNGEYEKANKVRADLVKKWTETEPETLDMLHGLQIIYITNCIAAKRFADAEPVLKEAKEESEQPYCKDPTHGWTVDICNAIVKLHEGKNDEAIALSKKCKQTEGIFNQNQKQ